MGNLISVIVPVYNVKSFLPKCIESITAQTFRNLEIIMIDDGSYDGSSDICDAWAEKDSRIRVIHQENKGVSAARNRGISESTGDYIGFVDGDDWCEPEMYESLLNSITESFSDVAMCGFVDYPNGEDYPVRKGVFPHNTCTFEDAIIPILQYKGYFTSLWNKLFKRTTIVKEGRTILMDESLGYGEDEAWLFEVLSEVNTVSFFPRTLYHWRPREGSATRTDVITTKQLSLLQAKKKIVEYLPQDRGIQSFVKGRIYNDCYILKVIAYCSKDSTNYKTICNYLKLFKKDWQSSHDVRVVRKIKVRLLDLLMRLNAPSRIVQRISDLR